MNEVLLTQVESKVTEKYEYTGPVDRKTGLAWVRTKYSTSALPGSLQAHEFHVRADGSRAYPHNFDTVSSFYDGVAIAKKCNQHFHIGPKGIPLYTHSYDEVGPFHNGRARVVKAGKTLHIDMRGVQVV